MKVLYVVGSNLRKNTSANISHNAYVQGLLENGCKVEILMASSSWGEDDHALPIWREAEYHIFNSVSSIQRAKAVFKNKIDKELINDKKVAVPSESTFGKAPMQHDFKITLRNMIKKTYDFLFNTSHIYHLDRIWLRNAKRFKETSPYDLIISNSSPASSHKLVLDLFSKKNLTKTRWIQIWEDPWFFDLYGGHHEKIKREEYRLLRAAQEIFYVSPLTLEYQKQHFPDCASKMKHIPLPFLHINEITRRIDSDEIKFGYFGDYYSKTRNLKPFYDAIMESKGEAYIYGDSDLTLPLTEYITVNGRVTLEKLNVLQNNVDVLVHLCNLQGGQIPGKIYHYSATTKPILFILDGTEREKEIIKEYFMKFNRYYFCENTKEEILNAINQFINGNEKFDKSPVYDFAPQKVIAELLRS